MTMMMMMGMMTMVDSLMTWIEEVSNRGDELTSDDLVRLEEACKNLSSMVYAEMSLRMHTRGRSSKRMIDKRGGAVSPMNMNRPG